MAYYGIEREGNSLQHFEWKKPTKYKDKKFVNGKWVYIYDNLKSKANYAVNRVKKSGEEAARKLKGKYYSTKSKAQELEAKVNRRLHGIKDASEVSGRYKNKEYARGWKDDGKAISTTRPRGNIVSTVTGKKDLYNNGYSKKSIEKNYKGQSPGAISTYNNAVTKERDKKWYWEQKMSKGTGKTIGGQKANRPTSSKHERNIIGGTPEIKKKKKKK